MSSAVTVARSATLAVPEPDVDIDAALLVEQQDELPCDRARTYSTDKAASNSTPAMRRRHASRDRLGNSEYVRLGTYEVSVRIDLRLSRFTICGR